MKKQIITLAVTGLLLSGCGDWNDSYRQKNE